MRNLLKGRDDDSGDIAGSTTEAISKWMAQHSEHLAHIVVHHGRSRLGRIAVEDIHPGREVEDILLDDERFGAGTFVLRARDRKDNALSGSVTVSVGREQKRVAEDTKRAAVEQQPDVVDQIFKVTGMLRDMGAFPTAGAGGVDAVTSAILPEMFRAMQGQTANPFGQARAAMEFVESVNGARQAAAGAQFGAHSELYDDDEDDDDGGQDVSTSTGMDLMGVLGGRVLSLLERHMVPQAATPTLTPAANLAGVAGVTPGGGLESPNVGPVSAGPTATHGPVFEPVEVEVSSVDSIRVELEKLATKYDGQRWFRWIVGAIQSGTSEEVVEAIETGVNGARLLRYGGPVFDLLDENPGQAYDALMDFLGWGGADPKRIATRTLYLDSLGGDSEDGPDDTGSFSDHGEPGRFDDDGEDDGEDDDGDAPAAVARHAGTAGGGYITLGAPAGRRPTWDDEGDDSDE